MVILESEVVVGRSFRFRWNPEAEAYLTSLDGFRSSKHSVKWLSGRMVYVTGSVERDPELLGWYWVAVEPLRTYTFLASRPELV